MTNHSRTARRILTAASVAALLPMFAPSAPTSAAPVAPEEVPVTQLDTLPTGRAPALAYRVDREIITPGGDRILVPAAPRRVEGPYTLFARRNGEYIVRVQKRFNPYQTTFGVRSNKQFRYIEEHWDGHATYRVVIPPGSDKMLLSSGGDGYRADKYVVSLRTGEVIGHHWRPSVLAESRSTPVVGYDAQGALVEVNDRLVRWTLGGKHEQLLPSMPDLHLVYASVDADLVAYRGSDGSVSFRRLSDPTTEVWTALYTQVFLTNLAPDAQHIVSLEGNLLVVRSTKDGAVVSAIHLAAGKRRRAVRDAVVFENNTSFLTTPLGGGVLRCTVRGRCAYAVPRGVPAQIQQFGE